MQKFAICAPSHFVGLCLCNLRHALTINTNMSSTSPHSMVNVGPLTSEIGSGVWGTPANFNRFCILASLLHQRRSTDANQTLHDVWPSPGLLHYVYIWGVGALAANGILPSAKFTLCPSLAFSYFGSITARHSSSGQTL